MQCSSGWRCCGGRCGNAWSRVIPCRESSGHPSVVIGANVALQFQHLIFGIEVGQMRRVRCPTQPPISPPYHPNQVLHLLDTNSPEHRAVEVKHFAQAPHRGTPTRTKGDPQKVSFSALQYTGGCKTVYPQLAHSSVGPYLGGGITHAVHRVNELPRDLLALRLRILLGQFDVYVLPDVAVLLQCAIQDKLPFRAKTR